MRVHSLCQSSSFLLSVLLLFVLCSADDKTFLVVGTGHCADCADNNFKPSQALSGLHVTIDCKLKNGDMKRVAAGILNDKGEFSLPLPEDIVGDKGRSLKHDCYAQLHSAAAIPCPAHSKIAFKSLDKNGKIYTFSPDKNLQFSAALCTSKFLWPHFKFPPLPKTHPWLKNFGHPWLHKPLFPPIYKPPIVKPLPPPVPVHKPPVVKPLPPPVPVYKPPKKPCPPKFKPPVYKPPKKPCPPKLKPPVYKPLPPPVPIYKPPIVKPLPPLVPIYKPPYFKKPCPPLPPLHKLPPFPKIPPKSSFKHPKFGGWPPLPPAIPQP